MELEDYFVFESADEIRIKGHRIWIEDVLHEYIFRERTAEQIARRFPTLTLDQIYATILYYLRNKESVNKYIADWLDYCQRSQEQFETRHPEFSERMREMRAEYRANRFADEHS